MLEFLTASDITIIVFLILIAFILWSGIKTVPQGYNYTVEQFGKYTKTLQPGLNFIIPFVQTVGNRQSVRETVLDIPTQEVITKDNASIEADGVVFYQVINAARATYEVNDLTNAMVNLAMTNIRSVMGSMDLDELLSNREQINARLLKVIDAACDPWGVKVTRVEIKDINPPADLVQAMGRQMKAERDKRAQILEAEGQRQSEILKAEGEKQSQILEAEGRREAAFRDAEARERLAEAEAKATDMMSKAIAEGDIQAINYFVAEKYVEALGKLATSPNQKVLMMPVEASSVIGSIGGIAELAKSALDDNKSTKHNRSVPNVERE